MICASISFGPFYAHLYLIESQTKEKTIAVALISYHTESRIMISGVQIVLKNMYYSNKVIDSKYRERRTPVGTKTLHCKFYLVISLNSYYHHYYNHRHVNGLVISRLLVQSWAPADYKCP